MSLDEIDKLTEQLCAEWRGVPQSPPRELHREIFLMGMAHAIKFIDDGDIAAILTRANALEAVYVDALADIAAKP